MERVALALEELLAAVHHRQLQRRAHSRLGLGAWRKILVSTRHTRVTAHALNARMYAPDAERAEVMVPTSSEMAANRVAKPAAESGSGAARCWPRPPTAAAGAAAADVAPVVADVALGCCWPSIWAVLGMG